jgi:hypothetical protein
MGLKTTYSVVRSAYRVKGKYELLYERCTQYAERYNAKRGKGIC